MTAELADEPELVQAVAKIAAKLDAALARQVIDLCAACFDAGVANGLVCRIMPSSSLLESLLRVRGIVGVSRAWVDGKPLHGPESDFR